jgi:hypothetical protein
MVLVVIISLSMVLTQLSEILTTFAKSNSFQQRIEIPTEGMVASVQICTDFLPQRLGHVVKCLAGQ